MVLIPENAFKILKIIESNMINTDTSNSGSQEVIAYHFITSRTVVKHH